MSYYLKTYLKNFVLESFSRWKDERIADLTDPMNIYTLIDHTIVSLEDVQEKETIILGIKYFEDPKEAKAFKKVMESFLKELLTKTHLKLTLKNYQYPNYQINLCEIIEPVELKCPNCQAPVYRILPTTFENLQNNYWIDDGDTIPMGGHIKQKDWDKNNFVPILEKGTCSDCGSHYFVVDFWCLGGMINENVQDSMSFF